MPNHYLPVNLPKAALYHARPLICVSLQKADLVIWMNYENDNIPLLQLCLHITLCLQAPRTTLQRCSNSNTHLCESTQETLMSQRVHTVMEWSHASSLLYQFSESDDIKGKKNKQSCKASVKTCTNRLRHCVIQSAPGRHTFWTTKNPNDPASKLAGTQPTTKAGILYCDLPEDQPDLDSLVRRVVEVIDFIFNRGVGQTTN